MMRIRRGRWLTPKVLDETSNNPHPRSAASHKLYAATLTTHGAVELYRDGRAG